MAPPKQAPERSGDPTIATILTWFVPGAGHLYLGQPVVALVAFLIVEGLYALGVLLSDGMFLEILPDEMRGGLAGLLTPEAGNLGAVLFQSRHFGFGVGHPRPFPSTMHLGMTLTMISGVLNLVLMSRAHFDARRALGAPRAAGVPGPAKAALLTWLVPGLGQWLQGRRRRAAVLFACVVGLFLVATVLGDGSNLDRERHFYYWSGQALAGLPAIAAEYVHGHPRLTHEVAYHDLAVVLGCVAGLLNVLCMLDAYGWSERRHLEAVAAPTRPLGSDLPMSAGVPAGADAPRAGSGEEFPA